MLVAKKFWPIKIGVFNPDLNPVLTLFGEASQDGTSIRSSKIEEFNSILRAGIENVRIYDPIEGILPDTLITSVDRDTQTIYFSKKASNGGMIQMMLLDWSKPTSGMDRAIEAVLCLNSNHTVFEFVDERKRVIRIPANTMVKGAIYYFQINEVISCTEGDFIGYTS